MFSLLIGVGEAKGGCAVFDGIGEGVGGEGTDPCIEGPDVRLRIDGDRLFLFKPSLHGLHKMLVRPSVIRKGKGAKGGSDPSQNGNGNVVGMNDHIGFRGERDQGGDQSVGNLLGMVAIKKKARVPKGI